jgi:nicotinamidase-related amidase
MKALLVIDVQNDYFPGGKFPLWNAEATLAAVETAMKHANEQKIPIILVQHVVKPAATAPFFGEGSPGGEIHPRVLALAPNAPVIVKEHADSFAETTLEATLSKLGATHLAIIGMMTHNCVTHTAISKDAEKYQVTVLPDCCTTVTEIMHGLALHALARRITLEPARTFIATPSS